MSFLKTIADAGKKQVVEKVKQTVKQNKVSVKQEKPKTPKLSFAKPRQDHLNLNPTVKSIKDIPNTNIMTSGKLLGVRLRDKKEPMLKQFVKYLNSLLEKEE